MLKDLFEEYRLATRELLVKELRKHIKIEDDNDPIIDEYIAQLRKGNR